MKQPDRWAEFASLARAHPEAPLTAPTDAWTEALFSRWRAASSPAPSHCFQDAVARMVVPAAVAAAALMLIVLFADLTFPFDFEGDSMPLLSAMEDLAVSD